jgi:hypothetical protein
LAERTADADTVDETIAQAADAHGAAGEALRVAFERAEEITAEAAAEAEQVRLQAEESAESLRAEVERRRVEVEEEAERLEVERLRLIEEQAAVDHVAAVLDDDPIGSSPVDDPDERTEGIVEEIFGNRHDDVDEAAVPERREQSRYERQSAKLPRIGDDAANVVRSLESFRKSLRGS